MMNAMHEKVPIQIRSMDIVLHGWCSVRVKYFKNKSFIQSLNTYFYIIIISRSMQNYGVGHLQSNSSEINSIECNILLSVVYYLLL